MRSCWSCLSSPSRRPSRSKSWNIPFRGICENPEVGFYGVTPTTRPAAYTQTYATATRTHSNPTAVDFTDNSGGSASDTIAAIVGGGAACEDTTKDAIASLARQSDRMVVDMANIKQVVNQIIDDLQLNGPLQ
jgi:hypothetical protein